jgi:hypothetical protein
MCDIVELCRLRFTVSAVGSQATLLHRSLTDVLASHELYASPTASEPATESYSTTSYLQSRQVKQQLCQQPCGGVSPGEEGCVVCLRQLPTALLSPAPICGETWGLMCRCAGTVERSDPQKSHSDSLVATCDGGTVAVRLLGKSKQDGHHVLFWYSRTVQYLL